jgi:hypothetical protein
MTLERLGRTVAVVAALSAAAAGCRQADGTIPRPQGEQANKTADVGRDLQNVAAQSEGATNDLLDDISNLSSAPPPPQLMSEMANALRTAVAGKAPSPESTQQLAESLYVAFTARDLSQRQIEALKTEVTDRTLKAGGDQQAASAVGELAARIQGEITANKRRWYHFF